MQVNAQSALAESVEVKTKQVACDGGGGSLGHPKVYLEMGNVSEVTCPYCSCHFIFIKAGVVSEDC